MRHLAHWNRAIGEARDFFFKVRFGKLLDSKYGDVTGIARFGEFWWLDVLPLLDRWCKVALDLNSAQNLKKSEDFPV